MKAGIRRLLAAVVFAVMVLAIVPMANASGTIEELVSVWGTDLFESSSWTTQELQSLFAERGFSLTEQQAQEIINLESQGLIEESRQFTLNLYGLTEAYEAYIRGAAHSAGSSPLSPTSSASVTSRLVFNEVVMPTTMTSLAKKAREEKKAKGAARTFGGVIRYAKLEAGDNDGEDIGFNLGLAKDFDAFTVGIILPYDHIDYDHVGETDRFGAVLFGQYHMDLAEELVASLTANVQYMYSDIDFDSGGSDSFDTYGGGLSASLTYDTGVFVWSAAAGYQYNEDDVDLEDDHQELIKVGTNLGMRFGENAAVSVFGVLNHDRTDYKFDLQDDDYFDFGVELNMNFSDTWGLTAGYKKVVDLEDYASDEVYLGTSVQF